MTKEIKVKVYTENREYIDYGQTHIAIYVTFPDEGKGERKLDDATVQELVESLNLHMAEFWARAWRDDDSPLQETATGKTRTAAILTTAKKMGVTIVSTVLNLAPIMKVGFAAR